MEPTALRLHRTGAAALSVREFLRNHDGHLVRQYYLARMPFDGPRHAPGCPFHEPDSARSGRSGYAEGVIEELHDGRLRIHLAGGLLHYEQAVLAQPVAGTALLPRGRPRPRQTEMSLLGLLHLLWEQAGLNALSPPEIRRRNWWPSVRLALQNAASSIMIGRHCLGDFFATIGYRDKDGPAQLTEAAARAGGQHRLLILGIVDRLLLRAPPDGEGGRQTLGIMFDGFRDFNLYVRGPGDLAQQLETSFPWAWRELQQPAAKRSARVVALVLATVRPDAADPNGLFAWIDSIALMEVGPALIPVASSYELAVLEALTEARRVFRKPLRFDADADVVHPDFELLDTVDPKGTPLEVFGRADEAYLARLAEKTAYYNATYGVSRWWAWDATKSRSWPPFPPAIDAVQDEDDP